MTSTVKNIKVGNTSYPVQDTKATPFLSSVDEATLLSDGTYRGETVANNTLFVKPDGALNNFTKPIIPPTWTSTSWQHTYVVYATHGTVVMTSGASYGSLMITRNGGSTWSTISIPSGGSGNGTCYHKGRWYNGNRYMLRYSEDDGTTWTTLSGLSTNNTGEVTRGSLFSNGSVMICSYTSRPKWFDEDNNAWVDGTGTYNDWSYPFAMDTVTNYVYTCSGTAGATIGKSLDCKVWNAVTVPVGYGRDVAAYNNIVIYAADAGLYCSTNGGSTWTKVDSLGTSIRDLYCLNGTFMARSRNAATGDFISTDGLNWTKVSGTAGETYGMVCYNGYFYTTNKRIPAGPQYDYTLTPLSYTASEIDETIADIPSWLTGTTDPTTSTEGSMGQRYLNTVSGTTFVCSGAEAPTTNYTVNGSPTIDSDYVMSGIGASNYITGPSFSWATSTSSKWSMEMEFTTPSTWNSREHLWAIGTVDNLGFIYNGTLIMALTAYGVVWNDTSYGVALSTSTHYKVKWEYTGSAMNMYVTSTDTYPSTPNVTKAQTGTISAADIFFGCRPSYSTQYFTGSIDLKSIKIYSDGTLVWEAVTENYSWEGLQNKLTAGTNITIDSNNVISATGGGSSASYNATTQEITL